MSLKNTAVCILAGGTGDRMYPLSITNKYSTKIYYNYSISYNYLLDDTYIFWSVLSDNIYILSFDDILLGKDVYDSVILYIDSILQKDPDTILILSVADGYRENDEILYNNIHNALEYVADNDVIISFLTKPNRIKTGNFYTLIPSQKTHNNLYKPYKTVMISDSNNHKMYEPSYDFYWSAGVWIGKAYVFADRIKKEKKNIWRDIDTYKTQKPVSFGIKTKYNMFENDPDLLVMPLDCGWIDLGTWGSIWYAMPRDEYGVAVKGQYYSYNNRNTLLYNTVDTPLIGAGLDGSAVIMTEYGATVFGNKDNEVAARIQGKYGNQYNKERGRYDKKPI